MIRYKVTRKNRISCMVFGRSPFSRKYLQNTIIKADPQTLGIFTFATKKDAEDFYGDNYDWLILRVQPVGRGKKPERISMYADTDAIRSFIKEDFSRAGTWIVPKGTICYPAVKVLD